MCGRLKTKTLLDARSSVERGGAFVQIDSDDAKVRLADLRTMRQVQLGPAKAADPSNEAHSL